MRQLNARRASVGRLTPFHARSDLPAGESVGYTPKGRLMSGFSRRRLARDAILASLSVLSD